MPSIDLVLSAYLEALERITTLENALKAAEKQIFDDAEKRDYDPPIPDVLVADIAYALNGQSSPKMLELRAQM